MHHCRFHEARLGIAMRQDFRRRLAGLGELFANDLNDWACNICRSRRNNVL